MRGPDERGFTLIELLLAITIFGMVAVGTMALFSATLDAHSYGEARQDLYREGLMIMERLKSELRTCTYVLIPNAHNRTRDTLAFSGLVNEDNDFYFNDPLFPRIDEDPQKDMNADNVSGIGSVDDDGDGSIDDGSSSDDDEDGLAEEDPMDGLDNDGDGNIDEDMDDDITMDGKSGIQGMDDDADGAVDEGDNKDDDEDGNKEEDPLNALVYLFDSSTHTLREWRSYTGQTADLSTRVASFQAFYETPERIVVSLTLTGNHGENVAFSESIFIENAIQKIGKRVR